MVAERQGTVAIRVTALERSNLDAASAASGVRLSDYVRHLLFGVTRGRDIKELNEGGDVAAMDYGKAAWDDVAAKAERKMKREKAKKAKAREARKAEKAAAEPKPASADKVRADSKRINADVKRKKAAKPKRAAAAPEPLTAKAPRAKRAPKGSKPKATKAAKPKAEPHPVEGCGLPYEKFRVGDKRLFADVATALNAQRSREGKFGKATRAQVLAHIGRLKSEAFERYNRECALEAEARSKPGHVYVQPVLRASDFHDEELPPPMAAPSMGARAPKVAKPAAFGDSARWEVDIEAGHANLTLGGMPYARVKENGSRWERKTFGAWENAGSKSEAMAWFNRQVAAVEKWSPAEVKKVYRQLADVFKPVPF